MIRLVALVMLLFLSPLSSPGQESEQELFIVHFSTGPAWDHEKPPGEQTAFGDHSANLGQLRSDGSILLGGRYEEFGLIILRSPSIEHAEALLSSDPGVEAGIFEFSVSPIHLFYPWKE